MAPILSVVLAGVLFCVPAWAVTFPDAKLEACIRGKLGIPTAPLTLTDVQGITTLTCYGKGIQDIEGIENLTSLTWLNLYSNQISDISALSALTGLVQLRLGSNQISDITALQGLLNLTFVSLEFNCITDFSPVSHVMDGQYSPQDPAKCSSTLPGTDVVVNPVDPTTGGTPVTITFDNVTSAGMTTVLIRETCAPPPGYRLGIPPACHELSTTATYTGPIEVCIDYSGTSYTNESELIFMVYEDTNGDGTADSWIDRTSSLDTTNNIICAIVTILHECAIFEIDNVAPVADPGPNQTVHIGATVTLDGSQSSDADLNYPLTYSWQVISAPSGSSVTLLDPTAVDPSFIPDAFGNYIIELVVTDSMGAASDSATVLISTYNTPPVADAGPDQAAILLGQIQLDGTKSYDDDGDPKTYSWTLTGVPAGSAAFLLDPTSATPTFTADVQGDYTAELIVSDP